MGIGDSSQEYKEPSPFFFRVLLNIIKWLVIDITVTGSVNAPSFLSHLPRSWNFHIPWMNRQR